MTRKNTNNDAHQAPTPTVIETFLNVGAYELSRLSQDKPSCFNGEVRVKRFRITVEPIEEPAEVIHQRLRDMWAKSDNHHHAEPLIKAARRFGLNLLAEGEPAFGSLRKKEKA